MDFYLDNKYILNLDLEVLQEFYFDLHLFVDLYNILMIYKNLINVIYNNFLNLLYLLISILISKSILFRIH
jgi:hypothetical protein